MQILVGVLQVGLVAALSYLAGSFPTSIVVGRLFFGRDPRTAGSGNAGGTNAMRLFGWKAGAAVMAIDAGKGVLAVLAIARLPAPAAVPREALAILAGSSAVVGHVWTVFAGFRGGKGMATAAGAAASLYPLALAFCLPVFGLVLALTGWVSAASMAAAMSFPFLLLLVRATGLQAVPPILFWASVPLALFILFTHRSNIRRLAAGTENRVEKAMIVRRLLRRLRGISPGE